MDPGVNSACGWADQQDDGRRARASTLFNFLVEVAQLPSAAGSGGRLKGLHGAVLLETHDGTVEWDGGDPFHLSQLARLRLPLLTPSAKAGAGVGSLAQECFAPGDAPGPNLFLIPDIDYLAGFGGVPEQVRR